MTKITITIEPGLAILGPGRTKETGSKIQGWLNRVRKEVQPEPRPEEPDINYEDWAFLSRLTWNYGEEAQKMEREADFEDPGLKVKEEWDKRIKEDHKFLGALLQKLRDMEDKAYG